jgi:hypothetical protein
MALRRCADLRGNTTLVDYPPLVETYRDVLYVPFGTPDASPGVFDHGRKLVTAAGYFRSDPYPKPLEDYHTTLNPDRYGAAPEDVTYLFLGHVTAHYGHFLFASMARLWALDHVPRAGLKLVVLNQGPLQDLLATPFIRAILETLSIEPGDIINFQEPTRIKRMVIPSPAIEEQNFAHRTFARMCNRIGARLTANRPVVVNDTPIFLSKMRLQGGIYRIVNEDEFCAHLEQAGVSMVFPETLPMSDQVMLFKQSPNISGMAGSALHTTIFASTRRMMALSQENLYLTNQILLDRANGGSTLCLYPHDDIERQADTPGFHHTMRLTDPRRTADQFLLALDRLMSANTAVSSPLRMGVETPVKTRNLALHRPARQSSAWVDPGLFPLGADPSEAVNGMLTGRYQFHTLSEPSPWWDVDLGESATLHELKLFNRLDACAERANKLSILLSEDGKGWSEAAKIDLAEPFGGLDGNPLAISLPNASKARFVRIQSNAVGHLHLDQVEVYGTT